MVDEETDDLEPLSAAVLAGGMSARMGVDKAMLSIRPGDPPMAAIVIGRLRAIADDVMLIASDRPRYEEFGVREVPDRFPGSAALGGIATALHAAKNRHCLVVACDMPFLNGELLQFMAAKRPRSFDVLAPTVPGESRQGGKVIFQTLHSIYSKDCLPWIEQQLAGGNRQVIGFFNHVVVETVPEETVRQFDPELKTFFNVNTPEAVDQARIWLSERT